jgi:hypothetical protein
MGFGLALALGASGIEYVARFRRAKITVPMHFSQRCRGRVEGALIDTIELQCNSSFEPVVG